MVVYLSPISTASYVAPSYGATSLYVASVIYIKSFKGNAAFPFSYPAFWFLNEIFLKFKFKVYICSIYPRDKSFPSWKWGVVEKWPLQDIKSA